MLQPQNGGKGKAIRTALAASTGEIVIVQDADLEYDPQDWPVLLEPIVAGKADACFGSRFLGGPHRVLYYWHSVGNTLLTLCSNMLTNLNLTDMETCYKAVRGDLARSLVGELESDRFGFEPEITARLAKRDARIYEVPISYAGRTYAEGKKINWKDGVAAFWHIVKFNTFGMTDRSRRWLLPATVALLALAACITSIGHDFTYDDRYVIMMNDRVHSLRGFWRFFAQSYWPPKFGGDGYRPVVILLFALQWVVGGGAAWVFHLTNIVLAVATALAVYWMALALLPPIGAWLAAALFAVHPVHVEVTGNMVGQAELMVGLSLVVAIGLYLRRRRDGTLATRDARRARTALRRRAVQQGARCGVPDPPAGARSGRWCATTGPGAPAS